MEAIVCIAGDTISTKIILPMFKLDINHGFHELFLNYCMFFCIRITIELISPTLRVRLSIHHLSKFPYNKNVILYSQKQIRKKIIDHLQKFIQIYCVAYM